VYDGRHHAREPVSTEICVALAQHFCVTYGIDPRSRGRRLERDLGRADGQSRRHQWVEDADPWWRKTLYDPNQNHLVEANEGSTHRNYDWHWTLENWSSATYGGPFPWRAPEAVAIRDLQLAHRPALNASFHSYGKRRSTPSATA